MVGILNRSNCNQTRFGSGISLIDRRRRCEMDEFITELMPARGLAWMKVRRRPWTIQGAWSLHVFRRGETGWQKTRRTYDWPLQLIRLHQTIRNTLHGRKGSGDVMLRVRDYRTDQLYVYVQRHERRRCARRDRSELERFSREAVAGRCEFSGRRCSCLRTSGSVLRKGSLQALYSTACGREPEPIATESHVKGRAVVCSTP